MGHEFLKTEKCEEVPFVSGSLIDDLDAWSRKLQVLGGAVSTIAWYKSRNVDSDCFFETQGETLGQIIEDYAKAIELTIEKNAAIFSDRKENIDILIKGCQETYDIVSKNRHISDICAIDRRVAELDEFLKGALVPAMRLKNNFETLKREILAINKKAPEAVAAAEGA